jgi:pimeloyl-ACP methyl ester carboxylesterase
MRLAHAAVNGIDLHYAIAGDGPLVVLVHGYPRHWYLFRHQLEALAGDHTVVAVDLRGYNLSSSPARDLDYGVWQSVEDVRGLVEQLGFDRLVLAGHDWGGAVAWSFALHHPELLDALVVMSAAHPAVLDRELREDGGWAGFMRILGAPDGPEVTSAGDFALLRQTLDVPFLDPEDRRAYLAAWRRPGAARSMLALDRREGLGPATPDGTPARGNYVPEVPSLVVRVPTVVLHADGDPYAPPRCFRGLERFAPGARVEQVDGSHWIPEEHPGLVADRIREAVAARA